MNDFKFLQNPISKEWVISAPRRAKRPDVAKGFEPPCPFCPGREGDEKEVYRVPSSIILSESEGFRSFTGRTVKQLSSKTVDSKTVDTALPTTDLPLHRSTDLQNQSFESYVASENSTDSNWKVRVIPNKFPFAPIHEIIIHSPEHGRNFELLEKEQVQLIFQTYRQRFQTHKEKGNVYIFHNRGKGAGESLPHPHTQLAVVPFEVKMDIPSLDPAGSVGVAHRPIGMEYAKERLEEQVGVETDHFYLFCPKTSQWPDEVWVSPKKRGRSFREITDEEISDLSFIVPRLIKILDLRHGQNFSFNFYIYPGGDWYLRLMPRVKTMGGFELGTGIFVNTQDPTETIAFIKAHFHKPDEEKIRKEAQADYKLHV